MNAHPSDADNNGESPRGAPVQQSTTSDDAAARECPPTGQRLGEPFALHSPPSTSFNTVPTAPVTAPTPMQALLDAATAHRRLQESNAATAAATSPRNSFSDATVNAIMEQILARQERQGHHQHHADHLAASAVSNPFAQQQPTSSAAGSLGHLVR